MTRRDFAWSAATATAALVTLEKGLRPSIAEPTLSVPVHRVTNSRASLTPEQLRRFWSSIWPETVRDFSRCCVHLQSSDGDGEIRMSPSDSPIFVGLKRSVLNVFLTDHIPMRWDKGRGLAGVTTLHEGYHLCLIALRYAHGHQVPFLSVNTCVHELLHAILQDIFLSRPRRVRLEGHEFRINWHATRVWLFEDGAAVRSSAQAYLRRLLAAG